MHPPSIAAPLITNSILVNKLIILSIAFTYNSTTLTLEVNPNTYKWLRMPYDGVERMFMAVEEVHMDIIKPLPSKSNSHRAENSYRKFLYPF